MKRQIAIFLLTAIVMLPAHAARRPGQAAIASAHPLATQAGEAILAKGGNAFDAAVAVSATLSVVEQFSSGLGGGGFWLLHRADDGFEIMVDGREVAPGAATADMYLDENGQPIPGLSTSGPLSSGIPGLPAGLAHISENYGRLSFAECLEPAVRLAQEGFPVFERMRRGLESKARVIRRWPTGDALYFPDGELPQEGSILHQPDLARTLQKLARHGRDGFYGGEVAALLIKDVRAEGGIWTAEDLSGYTVKERAPLVGHYRGARIVSVPLPSAGGIGLVNMLNILSGYELDSLDQTTRVHLTVEAMRRSYRDRAEYLGDPDFLDAPVARLTHEYYAAGQRASIRLDRATASADLPDYLGDISEGTDTSHFSVLDADGNRVAGTQTVNGWFGSGFVVAGTGVLLNNEMNDFSIKPGTEDIYRLVGGEANAIAPGKRMLSSMTPTFVESERGVAILGTPGGSRIISMVLLSTLAWMNGADVEQMVSLPRYHHQFLPDQITYEGGALGRQEVEALRSMGHTLSEMNRKYGNMQAVTWDYETGEVKSASDPRNTVGVPIRIY